MRNTIKPNFFLVGAPKCGTTSMCHYLKQHPSIFICNPKEPHYFGSTPGEHTWARNIKEYMSLFSDAQEPLCGDGSTSYLYTKSAADEIYHYNPSAKIIIMLRNLIDVLYAWHNELVYMGYENILSFEEALASEAERKLGKGIPHRCRSPRFLMYRNIVYYVEHIQRYYQKFGKSNVHVILYEDFRDSTAKVYQDLLMFLGADPRYVPKFEVHNQNKIVKNHFLHKFLPGNLKETRYFLEKSLPEPFFQNVLKGYTHYKKMIIDASTVKAPRPPMNPEFKASLQLEISEEIEQLSEFLGCDLSTWLK